MYIDYSMKLTDEQQSIIDKAVELLKPFDKEDCSFSLHFFRRKDIDGDEIGDEVCDNEKCVKKYLKQLRSEIGKGKRIYTVYDPYNNGDHERIDSCAICYRPLNEQLTWIKSEFEHHQEYSVTKEDLTESRTAFDVRCMLEAMPSVDYKIDEYHKHQNSLGNDKPLKEALKRQSDFVDEVVKYAALIVEVLSSSRHEKPLCGVGEKNRN